MKEIKAFLTSDMKIFASEDEAKIHEEYLNIFPIIDAFLDSESNSYKGVPQRAIARKSIAEWEKWKDENV
jgi:hypothetical protein